MNRRSLIALSGIAALLPSLRVTAQQTDRMPTVGVLQLASPEQFGWLVDGLREGLRQQGLVEGSNLRLLLRHADGIPERLAGLARELAAAGCRVIVTVGTTSVQAAQSGAPAVPIVMAGSADPVELGFARSLARPGGLITGISIMGRGILGKSIELLKEAVPAARAFAAFLQPANPGNAIFREALADAGRAFGVQVHVRDIRGPEEIAAAFAWAVDQKVDAAYLINDPIFFAHRETFARLAIAHRLPILSGQEAMASAGILLAYAYDYRAFARRAAHFVAEILRGVDPGTLPIEQPTAFRLYVNLKSARALGLTLPTPLLARADELIE